MNKNAARIASIDVVRGLVMVIMALDHVRDLFHTHSLTSDPLNLETTTPALFFTRWVTHLCAPTFVFLSGVSAYLSFRRNKDHRAARQFLLRRGVWLILLEFTVINFGVWADIQFPVFLFQVIGAIGVGFILLGLSIRLKPWLIGAIGATFVLILNSFALPPFLYEGLLKQFPQPVVALFSPQVIQAKSTTFLVVYPPLVWTAIMAMGFAAGNLMFTDTSGRRKLFFNTGLSLLILFVVLRFLNIYGDTAPWSVQPSPLYTFLSFINVTKYPPTLLFQLLFLGFMFLLLAAFERSENRFMRLLTVYGRVPLFYYMVHWYIIHPALFLLLLIQGYEPSDFRFGFNLGRPEGPSGLELSGVYLVWLAVILVLYPICTLYGRYKFSHPDKTWLKYI